MHDGRLMPGMRLPWRQAVKGGYQALLSDSVAGMRMDVYALCLAMIGSPGAPDAERA